MKLYKKQKRMMVIALFTLAVIGLILLIVFSVSRLFGMKTVREEPSLNVSISGVMPDQLNRNVLKNSLIVNGIQTNGGYFVPVAEKQAVIIRYGTDGKRVWKKSYSVGSDSYKIKNLISLPDGGFAFTVNPTAADNGDINGSPAVYRCDGDGNLLWSKDYADMGAAVLEHIFATGQGDILTAGYASSQGIYLTKLNGDGEKTAEKTISTDTDTLTSAAYIDGAGLSALMDTQSKSGTDTGTAALFDSDLNPVWKLTLPFTASGASFAMNSQALYTISNDNLFTKISLDGNIAFMMKMGDDSLSLPGKQADDSIVAWNNQTLFEYDADGSYIRTVPFDGGSVIKVFKEDDTLVVLSEKDKKILYTAYNADGKQTGRAVCGG